jgi:hypothetical protein
MLVDWLIFFLGLLIVTTGKEITIEKSYSDVFVGYFFLGFNIATTGNMFIFLTMIQKRKNIKTLGNLICPRRLQNTPQFDLYSVATPLVQIK